MVIDWVFRFLGVVASLNYRLSLFRINFVPLNAVLIIGLGCGVYVGVGKLRDAASNDRKPQEIDLADLMSSHAPPQQLVSVHGLRFSDARIQYRTKRSTARAWIPLVDPATRQALFVRVSPSLPRRENPEEVTLTGMLRPIDSELRPQLAKMNFRYGGIPVDSVFMLVDGERPEAMSSALGLTAVTSLTLGAFVFAIAKRNEVFRIGNVEANELLSVGEPMYSVSGRLMLNEKTSKRFTNFPAIVLPMETGELAIASKISVSSRLFGVKTSEQSGVWTTRILPGSVHDVQRGHLYYGLKRLPAIRFSYQTAGKHSAERAVLASLSGADPSQAIVGVPLAT